MSCEDIMTPDPLTIRADESVGVAADRLVAHRYVNLPVVDGEGVFRGMFGIYELLALLVPRVALAGGLLPNLRFMTDNPDELREKFHTVRHKTVGDAANRDAVVLHPDTPEIEAIRLFCSAHTTLAVVARESGVLVGIVSYWDAIRSLTKAPART